MNTVAAKYKLTRGTLQSLQQTTSTFAGIVKSFCKALNWDLLALIVSQFQDRIFFGVHQDLVELMKISVLNGQRARALFDAGYQNLVDLSKANVLSIEKCLIDSICFDVQKRDGETNYDADQRNKRRLLFVTGKAGLTVKDAAQLIIDEARQYLRNEMGIENINWTQQHETDTNDAARSDDANADPIVLATDNQDKAEAQMENHQKTQKRRISLDKEVATPNKRRNHGHVHQIEHIVSEESSSDVSDVDSIILDNSVTFYNDENDDFLKQLRPQNNIPALPNGEYSLAPRLKIIDVTKTAVEFNDFVKSLQNVMKCGFSLAIARLDATNALQRYNCVISSEFYLYGAAFSFQDKYTVHFVNLQNDENRIDFNKKNDFIRNLLAKRKLTLQINDAKTQLKTLMMAFPSIQRINCAIEDPQVAQWLIQPEDDRSFSKLVCNFAF